MWQLQLLDVHSGDAVGWGTGCRFRHALSGGYLCASEVRLRLRLRLRVRVSQP